MVVRDILPALSDLARHYPVVTVTGPRQSGKTTLCRAVFPDKAYVSLEPLDVRDYARSDPRGFLAEHSEGAILDEVQNVPELLSYLQVEVDERPDPGRFILTGSQQFGLVQGIAQSLAGRTGMLTLLPLTYGEIRRFASPPTNLLTVLWTGGYPRIHDRGVPADRWLADYVTTYVQRDVRQVLNVGDLSAFTTFVKLCAGRTAQELNLSALGADAGISHNTARAWLSVLEASYLCFRLPAFHANQRKQLVKAPKLHVVDSGLACQLLGIRSPVELAHHPLRGALFESWVASEVLKARVNGGLEPRLGHFRETRGVEVDLLVDLADRLIAVESKSGATVVSDHLVGLREFALGHPGDARPVECRLAYGGEPSQTRTDVAILSWKDIGDSKWS